MLKVMFVCSAGMSTSLLVENVKKAAVAKGTELNVYAVGQSEAEKDLTQAQILLLGPQVGYLESKFRKKLEGTNVKLGKIDMIAYGRMDGEKVLAQILELSQK
ncbi:MAG: PTS sugar transporter subunit IIB [Clostridiales bacterium]|jgi:PTS system cellobiose-specific IIB component|nr:PTS sugar transporter subunit IIB [Clostridiales bacterium]